MPSSTEHALAPKATDADHLIRYHSRSTVNGKPVGVVYVVDIAYLSGRGSYSYTKDPDEATRFTKAEAARVMSARRSGTWPSRCAVPVAGAEVLP